MDKEQNFHQEAYNQAEKELLEERVEEVKELILETLKKTETKKKEKGKIEEELRILKNDLEDLRNGRFEKIKERQEKSQVARGVSVDINIIAPAGMPIPRMPFVPTLNGMDATLYRFPSDAWSEATSGTYMTVDKTYYL